MKELGFIIDGMTCTSCSSSITRSLSRKPYTKDFSVNLLTKEARITYDETLADKEAIFALVRKLGYDPSELAEDIKLEAEDAKLEAGANAKIDSISGTKSDKTANAKIDSTASAKAAKAAKADKATKGVKTSQAFSLATLYKRVDALLTPTIRLSTAIIATLIVLYVSFASTGLSTGEKIVVELVLSAIVMHMGNYFFIRGFRSLFMLAPNMDSLIAIGVSASVLYSLYQSFEYFVSGAQPVLYFHSACTILSFILVGKTIEGGTRDRAKDELYSLLDTKIDKAIKLVDGAEVEVAVSRVQKGDILKVLPFSLVPADGVVKDGAPYINEAMLNGESIPVDKDVGSRVFCMSENMDATFIMEVQKSGNETFIAKVFTLIKDAQTSRAKISRIVDRVSLIFVPLVISLATLSALFWYAQGESFAFVVSIFVSVLVISCPCALGIATPMALLVASYNASKNKIFFKNIKTLEIARELKSIVFDKTGTLTSASLSISSVDIYDASIDKKRLLALASALEKNSNHIIAKTLKAYASPIDVQEAREKKGSHVEGVIDGTHYKIGRLDSALLEGIDGAKNYASTPGIKVALSLLDAKEGQAQVGSEDKGEKLLGVIVLEDTLKDNSIDAIKRLKDYELYILSGDNEANVRTIASKLGIENFRADIMPEEKLGFIQGLTKRPMMMVGDGINDAPALAYADIAMVMGSGNDIAIDVADIISFDNNIDNISYIIGLSSATIRNIRQNLGFALGYNIVLIPVAMGALIPLGISLNPMVAALAMSCSSLCVVGNALRLKYYKEEK